MFGFMANMFGVEEEPIPEETPEGCLDQLWRWCFCPTLAPTAYQGTFVHGNRMSTDRSFIRIYGSAMTYVIHENTSCCCGSFHYRRTRCGKKIINQWNEDKWVPSCFPLPCCCGSPCSPFKVEGNPASGSFTHKGVVYSQNPIRMVANRLF